MRLEDVQFTYEMPVIMLAGLPASGKSTFANQYAKEHNMLIISKDIIRYELAKIEHGNKSRAELQYCLEYYSKFTNKIIELLSKYFSLVHSNTFNSTIINNDVKNIKGHQSTILQFLTSATSDMVVKNYQGVILDSTHFTRKQRAKCFGSYLHRYPIICIYFDISLQESIKRNLARKQNNEYYVPDDVLYSMHKKVEFPHVAEGFRQVFIVDNLTVVNNKDRVLNLPNNIDDAKNVFPSFARCIGYDQHNLHHSHMLDEHLLNCANFFAKEDIKLFLTSLLHDVGKVDTCINTVILNTNFAGLKKNKKLVVKNKDDYNYYVVNYNTNIEYIVPIECADMDVNNHYYNHQNVSAQLAYRDLISNGFSQEFALTIYWMIFYHMDVSTEIPFTIPKTIVKKMQEKLTDEEIKLVQLFKVADVQK